MEKFTLVLLISTICLLSIVEKCSSEMMMNDENDETYDEAII
jgi:hypothetical protein